VRAPVLNRVVAKGIDIFLIIVMATILPGLIGPPLGIIYSLLADGITYKMFHSQSVGKKVVGLQVRSLVSKGPGSYRDSAVRNSPIAFVTLFACIPVAGWLIAFLVGIPLILIEIYLMVRVETGYRLGDVMADTEVIQVQSLVSS
jgi:uncharacterized membrane protein